MVKRMSEDFNLNPAQGSGIAVPAQGTQQDVTGKYRTVNPVEGAATSVLQSLYGAGAKLGESMWRNSIEEAYVKGAAQAGVVAAEQDLQNDGLTRDWEVAGYRDTSGKLQQAKQESAFLAALPELRTKGIDEPGGLNEYLATQRTEYESTYNGMSREAREGSVAKRITFEQQAIAQYTKARKEYIYGVRSTALRSTFNPAIAKLESALVGGDPKEIVTARENVATIFAADVWNQSGVSDDDKRALTKELLDRLFVTDDTGTYGMLDQVGLLNKLSAEDQTKYAEKYRESLNRNNARRFAEYDDELAQLKANMADPNSPAFPDVDTFKRVVDYGIYQGALKDTQGRELKTAYYTALGKRTATHNLAAAYSSGNQDAIYGTGKSVQDALDAWEAQQYASGKTTEQVAALHIEKGSMNGWPEAYQRAGKLLAPVFSSIITSKEPPAAMVQTARNFFSVMDTLEKSGRTVDFSQVLAGIPEDLRGDVLALRGKLRANESPETALLAVADQRARTQQLTPSMRAGMAAAQGKTAATMIADMQRGGVFNEVVKKLRGAVGLDTSERALRPFTAPFEDTTAADLYVSNVRKSAELHLSRAIQADPYLQGEQLQTKAMAGVAESLLDTKSGPVMMPPGVNMHSYFDLPAVANKDNVAAVLSKQAAATVEGAVPVVSLEDGNVVVREFKSGQQVAQRSFSTKIVGEGVRSLLAADAKRTSSVSGEGVVKKDIASQATVRFNGRNTAAVDDALMFKFRENLVINEGIKDMAYSDRSNKRTGRNVLTVGVGISSTNTFFPKDLVKKPGDKVPQEVIDSTFRDASNAAAKEGLKILQQYELPGDRWFLLAAELAYQSGAGTLQKNQAYREMFDAAATGNTALAIEAFRRSPAHLYSKELRRKHYEKLINQALRG